jgi:signal transduction histidine kinase
MKLVTRTSLFYLLPGIPILMLAGFICYEIANEEIEENNDWLLYNIGKQVEKYIVKSDTLTLRAFRASNQAEITEVKITDNNVIKFSDTLVYDKLEDEYNKNRLLTQYIKANGKNFRIRIYRATMESEQLIQGIFIAFLTILGMLIIVYFILNYYASKILWKPFYKVLENLSSFHASDGRVPAFIKSKIGEFEDLNTSLFAMMQTMIVDFDRQKKFTEAVSHEIQTPLAIIKSKIEVLIQSPEINAKIAPLIIVIDDACSKLIRINRSLILLTRIENKQFKSDDTISFIKKIKGALQLFEDPIANAQLSLTTDFQEDFIVIANMDLCMILVNNLLQNAIRHNYKAGKIKICVSNDRFSISNSGQKNALDQDKLFKRFNKDDEIKDSIGLGLSISKEIAETSNLVLEYVYEENNHTFIVRQTTK